MSLLRLGFAFYFGESSQLMQNSTDFKKAMILGLRYDLIPLAYIHLLPFILLTIGCFIPGKTIIKVLRSLIISILLFGYILLGWVYICDYGFYSYFQEHINVLFFGLFEDDTEAVLISIFKNYNVFFWTTLLAIVHYAIFKLIHFSFSPFDFDLKNKVNNFKISLIFLSGFSVLVFMSRGNFSRLPLSVEDAYISDNEFINEISLNGVLTLNRAIKIRKVFGKDNFNYLASNGFKDWREAYEAYFEKRPMFEDIHQSLEAKTKKNDFLKSNPPHVVLIVMESMGSYWNEYDSSNFQILGELKEHFNKGILFNNFLPSENGTIGSIVSVVTSQVVRPGSRFLSESEYMKIPLEISGNRAFKESGYETNFVYGGKLGWRNLGKFLAVQGYDKLWGADEIKEAMPELKLFSESDLGNEWGIFDEYLYSFIEEQLRTAIKPQLFVILTTTNHPPFEYPSSYQPRTLKLTAEFLSKITVDEELARKRFLGLQYANQKVGEFFTRVNRSFLRENTILALTGDHSFWIAKGVGLDQEFKRYAVPFFLSIPQDYMPSKVDTSNFGSHEDIFPTLINLALSEQKYIKLGEDMFNEESSAINSSGLMANKEGAFHHNKFWIWKDINKLLLEKAESDKPIKKLKNKGKGLISLTDSYLKNEKNRKKLASKNDRP